MLQIIYPPLNVAFCCFNVSYINIPKLGQIQPKISVLTSAQEISVTVFTTVDCCLVMDGVHEVLSLLLLLLSRSTGPAAADCDTM